MSSRELFADVVFTKTFGYYLLKRICCVDTREKAIEFDKNAIIVFTSGDKETLVGHLPTEIFCLLTYFLKASPENENKLNVIVVRKRKREAEVAVPAKCCSYKEQNIGKYFIKEVRREEKKYPYLEFDIITTTITNNATKYKLVYII